MMFRELFCKCFLVGLQYVCVCTVILKKMRYLKNENFVRTIALTLIKRHTFLTMVNSVIYAGKIFMLIDTFI